MPFFKKYLKPYSAELPYIPAAPSFCKKAEYYLDETAFFLYNDGSYRNFYPRKDIGYGKRI